MTDLKKVCRVGGVLRPTAGSMTLWDDPKTTAERRDPRWLRLRCKEEGIEVMSIQLDGRVGDRLQWVILTMEPVGKELRTLLSEEASHFIGADIRFADPVSG